jgi:penicillin-binding protein 1A
MARKPPSFENARNAKKPPKEAVISAAAPQKRSKSRKKPLPNSVRYTITAMRWGINLALWAAIFIGGVLLWYGSQLPNIDVVYDLKRRPSVTMLAADGQVLTTFGTLYGETVEIKDLPPELIHAIVATEDRRFYEHGGIDFRGIARAAVTNITQGHLSQGGSSITQQLAKNLFLSNERTLTRKLKEVVFALWLEHNLSKEEILRLYLNRVYFGAGTFGVDAAAQRYFQRSSRELNVAESAMLIGLLKAPSKFNPLVNPERAERRKNEVLHNMQEAGYLNEQDLALAKQETINLAAGRTELGARFFADWVFDQIPQFAGYINEDIVVQTTLDRNAQSVAEATLKKHINQEGMAHNISQGSLLTLADTGAVLAMVGGTEYQYSQFNRATQALRQSGSSFKVFVALAALQAGWTPETTITDKPLNIDGWKPTNYDNKFRGEVTLKQTIVESLNVPAVQIAKQVGMGAVITMARKLGVTAPIRRDLSSALGTSEATLLDMTTAYSVLSADGQGVIPYGIERIQTRKGETLYERTGNGLGQVLDEAVVVQMKSMLQDVIESPSGTGKGARITHPAGGKTGTSQDFRDAWFIGYSQGITTGIWLGNDDNAPMDKVTGGSLPARIWKEYMGEILP